MKAPAMLTALLLTALPMPAAADLADVFKVVKPSVVYIVSALPGGAASGSGFVLSSDRTKSEIVTANHVVEAASAIDVVLDSDPSKRYHATVLQRDHVRDVAILEIPVGNRKALPFLPASDVHEGMSIAVVGYPRVAKAFQTIEGDDLRPTVHAGLVSAIRLDGAMYQFDAPTDHGASGGPVVDVKTGSVIGIVRGAVLDATYLARGLEMPLPGSAFAMSGTSIAAAARGEALPVAAARGEALPVAAAGSAPKTLTTGSADFRVAFVRQSFANHVQQSIGDELASRVASDFKTENGFYSVPAAIDADDVSTGRLGTKCEDLRVNGIVVPLLSWQETGDLSYLPYIGRVDTRKMNVGIQLVALDCSGAVLFHASKRKSEGLRTPTNREIVNMANDLIDQAQRDFSAFREAHAAAWNNLLKTGLFLNPSDTARHALLSTYKDRDGHWRVRSVWRGGPADVAGVKPGDQLQSINGQNPDGAENVDAMLDAESVTLVVGRPGGPVTLTVVPRQYEALLKMTGRRT